MASLKLLAKRFHVLNISFHKSIERRALGGFESEALEAMTKVNTPLTEGTHPTGIPKRLSLHIISLEF